MSEPHDSCYVGLRSRIKTLEEELASAVAALSGRTVLCVCGGRAELEKVRGELASILAPVDDELVQAALEFAQEHLPWVNHPIRNSMDVANNRCVSLARAYRQAIAMAKESEKDAAIWPHLEEMRKSLAADKNNIEARLKSAEAERDAALKREGDLLEAIASLNGYENYAEMVSDTGPCASKSKESK